MRINLLPLLLASFLLSAALPQEGKKKKEKKGKEPAPDATQQAKLERLLLDAEKSKVIEDWEEAIRLYNEFITKTPQNANAHFQLSQIYAAQRKWSQAEEAGLNAVKADPKNKWFLESLASVYLNQGKGKEAAEMYKTLITRFPPNPDYYLNLAFLYARTAQWDLAIKTYNQFEKIFGVDEQVVMEKKNIFLHQNKFQEALAEVKKLVEAFPGETPYLLMEAELFMANKMINEAVVVYKQVLAIEPENAQALLALADIGMQNGSTAESLAGIKKVFENPNVDIDAKIKILFPYIQFWDLKKEKKQDAFDLAEILVRVHPGDAKSFAISGDLYYLDNQNEKALEAYLQSLKINRDVLLVWQQVLVLHNQLKDWEQLKKTSAEAAELFPNQAFIYLFKGGAEYQLKEYEQAVKTFSKGEKVSGDNDKLRAQFFSNMGDAYHSLRQHEQSDSAYEKSLRLDSENAYVLNNYSYYLSLRNTQLEKAKQMSAYSNKLVPRNSSFLDTYAWILFRLKEYESAREWQEKAIAASAGEEPSATLLEHYGDILFMLGKKTEAVGYWKKAKERGSDSETLDRKIAEERYTE